MHTYYAASSKLVFVGGLSQCIRWSEKQIEARKAKIVKIIKARPNEKDGRIIFEVTKDGTFATNNGRIIHLSLLKKAEKYGRT